MTAGIKGPELVVLGAGPAYTDRPGATGAAYLIRHRDGAILLDLGQGSFPRLAGELEPSELLAVLVSHLHPDHFVDLVPLRHYLRWHLHPSRRVRVLGPDGLAGRLDGLHAEPGFSAATLDIERLAEGGRTIGPFAIGVVYDATGGWTAPLWLLMVLVLPLLAVGAYAGRPAYLEDQLGR